MKMEGCLSISRSSSSSCYCFSLSSSSLVSCPIITMINYYNCYTGPPGGGGGFLLKKNNNGGRGCVATAVSANQVSRGDDGDGQQHDNNNNNNKNDKDDAAADDQQPLPLVVNISNGGFSSSTLPPPTPIPAASSSYSFSSVDNFNTFEDFKNNTTPNTSTNASGTTRAGAGLFRTPISGGVQSATSVHDLPRPPLAVRNLMEQARFAHLCTVMSRMHHRREGYPFGSLVDFAPDAMGHPIFSFSPLAIHTRNLLADPRCTLVVQIPGWSGLSNARATIFGDVYPLPEDQQEWAHKQYIAKHQQGPSQKWGNFYYFRMQNISDIYFIGGFGTVAWVNVTEYEAIWPDKIAVDGGEQNLKELNAIFSKPLKDLLSLEAEVDDVALISIDSKGTDVRVRQGAQFNIQRLAFEEANGVETLEEAKTALWNLICRGGGELKLEHKL